jgi:hypothetical protein
MSSVSRSVYQKLKEENKRLLKDIRILTDQEYSLSVQRLLVINKWRETFKKEQDFWNTMRLISRKYLNEKTKLKSSMKLGDKDTIEYTKSIENGKE